jgi:hypothetical protein
MSVVSFGTFVDFSDKSINIDQWGADSIDLAAWVGSVHAYIDSINGPALDTSPVDMVQWAVAGTAAPTGMEHWQTCLNLMVHT